VIAAVNREHGIGRLRNRVGCVTTSPRRNIKTLDVLNVGRLSRVKLAFLRSFAADLRACGVTATVKQGSSGVAFSCEQLPDTPRRLLAVAKRIRANQAAESKRFLREVLETHRDGLLRPGAPPADCVTFRVKLCRDPEDFRLFTYCRLLQRIPTAPLVGRRMSFLILADSHGGIESRLVGAFGLNGSSYSLRDRDAFLGWTGDRGFNRKVTGLQCIMDMPVCVALPEWAAIRGGKLVAAISCSSEVADLFAGWYANRLPRGGGLLAIVTLCATGAHCPIFNRIMLRPGGLFRRVGMTAGFSIAFVSDATVDRARQVLRSVNRHPKPELFAKSLRLVQRSLYACGLPGDALLRLGVRKGINIGTGDAAAVEMLRSGRYGQIHRPSLHDVTTYWRRLVARMETSNVCSIR
jgi:hypothetical protein